MLNKQSMSLKKKKIERRFGKNFSNAENPYTNFYYILRNVINKLIITYVHCHKSFEDHNCSNIYS